MLLRPLFARRGAAVPGQRAVAARDGELAGRRQGPGVALGRLCGAVKVAAAVDEELRDALRVVRRGDVERVVIGRDRRRCQRVGGPVEEHGGAARRVEARADVERRPAVGRRGLVGSGAGFQEL